VRRRWPPPPPASSRTPTGRKRWRRERSRRRNERRRRWRRSLTKFVCRRGTRTKAKRKRRRKTFEFHLRSSLFPSLLSSEEAFLSLSSNGNSCLLSFRASHFPSLSPSFALPPPHNIEICDRPALPSLPLSVPSLDEISPAASSSPRDSFPSRTNAAVPAATTSSAAVVRWTATPLRTTRHSLQWTCFNSTRGSSSAPAGLSDSDVPSPSLSRCRPPITATFFRREATATVTDDEEAGMEAARRRRD
jgi:hypothetical protein